MKDILKKLFHPPEYPDQLPSKWGKVSYWYQWHIRLMDMGRGEVFGKVTQLFSESALFLLVLDKLGYTNLSLWYIAVFCVCGACLVWLTGWCYVMLKQDIVKTILNRYRDTMFRDMHDLLNKKKKVDNNDK